MVAGYVCGCGHEALLGGKYCSNCGARLPEWGFNEVPARPFLKSVRTFEPKKGIVLQFITGTLKPSPFVHIVELDGLSEDTIGIIGANGTGAIVKGINTEVNNG